MTQEWIHIPIMAETICEMLLTNLDGVYVDGTLGLGGHTKFLLCRLSEKARIIGFDKDSEAIEIAKKKVDDSRLITVHGSYIEVPDKIMQLGYQRADGMLLDLGLSSYQLDNPARGFSIVNNGPLDMRFDSTKGITASTIVNSWPMAELERIFTDYGEEKNSTKIALAIMQARASNRIETTEQLKKIVENVSPKRGKIHPATQIFQALRIACNQELEAVTNIFTRLDTVVKTGGRVAVLTFHSLEDRIVKNSFKNLVQTGHWKLINKHALSPTYQEICTNRRSRSAKLRVIERVS